MQIKFKNNPFEVKKNLWHIEFESIYRFKDLIELYFEDKSLALTSFEKFSKDIIPDDKDEWVFTVYFDAEPDRENIYSDLQKIIGEIINFSISEVDQQDWVDKLNKDYKPLIVNEFFISNKDHINKKPADKILLQIENTMAFGTGDHYTTKLCLEKISELKTENFSPSNILDVGTGTGILAIASKKIWPSCNLVATEIDDVALNIAKQNGTINNSEITFISNHENEIFNNKFDLIIANILAKPLMDMSKGLYQLLNKNGLMILSGIIESQYQMVLDAYEDKSFTLISKDKKEHWIALTFSRN